MILYFLVSRDEIKVIHNWDETMISIISDERYGLNIFGVIRTIFYCIIILTIMELSIDFILKISERSISLYIYIYIYIFIYIYIHIFMRLINMRRAFYSNNMAFLIIISFIDSNNYNIL